METLELTQNRHKETLMALNQIESILSPIHTGAGNRDLLNFNSFNIERLAKNKELISTGFIKIDLTHKQQRLPHDHPRYSANPDFEWGAPTYDNDMVLIDIKGPDFGYTFAPQQICNIKKRLERSFASAESFTKKALKLQRMKPAQPKPSIPELKAQIQKKEKTARYLYGNKRGLVWGRKTQADEKREHEIEKLKSQARAAEVKEKALLITKPVQLKNNKATVAPAKSKYDYLCAMHDNSKYPVIINLVIKKKFFDQILSGEKTKEYRAPSKFNARLLGFKDANGKYSPRKDITHIRFVNGYSPDSPMLVAECKEIGCYTFVNEIPEGLKKGAIALEIILGKIVEHKP